MMIAHFSDAHVLDPRFPDGAHDRLHDLCRRIAEEEDRRSTVVCVTGDLGWDMSAEEARLIVEAMEPLRGWKVLHAKGNHDHGPLGLVRRTGAVERWRAMVDDMTGYLPGEYPSARYVAFQGVAFIVANSSWDQTFLARGRIGELQIKAIARGVERARKMGLRLVLMLHHCPSGGDRTKRLSDRDEFGAALEEVGGVDLMLTGHLHRAKEWRGVYGADWLISAPAATEDGRYRKIWWDGARLRWEWG